VFCDDTDKEGYRCQIFYNDGIYKVAVTSPKGECKSETFGQIFTPTFGMDVVDVAQANEIAERLAVSLGATPYDPTPSDSGGSR
jgi:hypothetical protein